MKIIARFTALAGTLLLAAATFAQSGPVTPVPVPDDHPIWSDPALDLSRVSISADYMVQEFNLNEDQSRQLHAIEEETNRQLRAMEALEPAQQDQRAKALLDARQAQVAKVLTKEQLTSLDAIKKDHLRDLAAKLAVQRAIGAGR